MRENLTFVFQVTFGQQPVKSQPTPSSHVGPAVPHAYGGALAVDSVPAEDGGHRGLKSE